MEFHFVSQFERRCYMCKWDIPLSWEKPRATLYPEVTSQYTARQNKIILCNPSLYIREILHISCICKKIKPEIRLTQE